MSSINGTCYFVSDFCQKSACPYVPIRRLACPLYSVLTLLASVGHLFPCGRLCGHLCALRCEHFLGLRYFKTFTQPSVSISPQRKNYCRFLICIIFPLLMYDFRVRAFSRACVSRIFINIYALFCLDLVLQYLYLCIILLRSLFLFVYLCVFLFLLGRPALQEPSGAWVFFNILLK